VELGVEVSPTTNLSFNQMVGVLVQFEKALRVVVVKVMKEHLLFSA
jgi:hypothetical protein